MKTPFYDGPLKLAVRFPLTILLNSEYQDLNEDLKFKDFWSFWSTFDKMWKNVVQVLKGRLQSSRLWWIWSWKEFFNISIPDTFEFWQFSRKRQYHWEKRAKDWKNRDTYASKWGQIWIRYVIFLLQNKIWIIENFSLAQLRLFTVAWHFMTYQSVDVKSWNTFYYRYLIVDDKIFEFRVRFAKYYQLDCIAIRFIESFIIYWSQRNIRKHARIMNEQIFYHSKIPKYVIYYINKYKILSQSLTSFTNETISYNVLFRLPIHSNVRSPKFLFPINAQTFLINLLIIT